MSRPDKLFYLAHRNLKDIEALYLGTDMYLDSVCNFIRQGILADLRFVTSEKQALSMARAIEKALSVEDDTKMLDAYYDVLNAAQFYTIGMRPLLNLNEPAIYPNGSGGFIAHGGVQPQPDMDEDADEDQDVA